MPHVGPTLGLVIIPCNTVVNGRENPAKTEDGSFTTYRLQTDLSIIGDLYGSQEREIMRFRGRRFGRRSESYSSHLITTDTDSASEDERWSPYRSKWTLDFSEIANEVLVSEPFTRPVQGRSSRYKLRNEVVDKIKKSDFRYETL
jgi:hypothetical protein